MPKRTERREGRGLEVRWSGFEVPKCVEWHFWLDSQSLVRVTAEHMGSSKKPVNPRRHGVRLRIISD